MVRICESAGFESVHCTVRRDLSSDWEGKDPAFMEENTVELQFTGTSAREQLKSLWMYV